MSWILAKDGSSFFNTDHIIMVYCTGDFILRVITTNDKTFKLGRYNTPEETETALKMVLKGVIANKDVQAPDDEKVYSVLRSTIKTKERASDGKKPVRRGGS